jgi:hypothetical protein
MKVLFPAWTSAKADEAKLNALHDLAVQLLLQGLHPDMSAAQMHLLTAKLPSRDLSALKKSLLRPGFVEEWNKLDSQASAFAKGLLAKQNAKPSACFKLFMSYDPEAVLWLGFISKDKAVQERYNLFLKVWPEARQRIPHLLMQEMRITPELPVYGELVLKIFLELIDGHLTTPEEMRAFLEPYSPPAPPPQVTIKRSRARRAGARIKEQALEEEEAEDVLVDEDLEPVVADDEELDLAILPKGSLVVDLDADGEEEDELEAEEAEPVPASKKLAAKKGQKPVPAGKPAVAKPLVPAAPAKPTAAKAQPAAALKKPAPAPARPKSAKPAKPEVKAPAPAKAKAAAAKPVKAAANAPAKKPALAKAAKPKAKPKPPAKPLKKAPAKPSKKAAKKPAAKARKKR